MRRRTIAAAGLAGAAALAALLSARSPGTAQGPGSPPAPAAKLPIKKVVLFSSGVGYFQRDGEVDGEAKVDLTFPAGDVNDLLKSLTVNDLGGGQVQAVSYDSRDPIERTLKSFAIDLAGNPSQAQLLDQCRGERVEVGLIGSTVTGTVVGVETRTVPDKEGHQLKVEFLNVLTAEGLRSVKLTDVQQIKLLNPALEGELRKALETLSLSKDTRKKVVSVQFKGAGKRPVRVSYVNETPVWKTSYRLVLDKDGKPFLQGWAVVENPSDEDWSDVRMALVSGRPISFRMDLYTPLYVPRPLVEPEMFASLRPPAYEGSMDQARFRVAVSMPQPPANQPADAAAIAGAPVMKSTDAAGRGRRAGKEAGEVLHGYQNALGETAVNLGQGVTSAAQAAQLGDFFQYTIADAVSVARQKSALIPIVNREVDGSRVSIYNRNTLAKHPLLGLRFKNAPGLNLMQGPVTVFDGPSYAGDARLPDVQPGEERLISYAIDLGTEVEVKPKGASGRTIAAKIDKGILVVTDKLRQEVVYYAVNRSETDRTLLIEHPFQPEFKLTSEPKPAERSRDQYRFEVKLAAGKSADLPVAEERDLVQRVALTNLNADQIRLYIQAPVVSDKVKNALAEALRLQAQVAAARRDLESVNRQLTEIAQDQDRLRKNLKEVPEGSAVRKRYVEKFDQQETLIEKLQSDQRRLQETVQKQQQQFDAYLAGLTVE